jgi:DNA-binding response OmpR family regulator
LSNKKRRSSIHINKRGLFIDGDPINAPPRTVALLACLHPNLGRVVPYRQLLNALGYNPARRGAQKHLLRQYMLLIKTMLSVHKVPYVLAVAHNVGYGLCELADKNMASSRARTANRLRVIR